MLHDMIQNVTDAFLALQSPLWHPLRCPRLSPLRSQPLSRHQVGSAGHFVEFLQLFFKEKLVLTPNVADLKPA